MKKVIFILVVAFLATSFVQAATVSKISNLETKSVSVNFENATDANASFLAFASAEDKKACEKKCDKKAEKKECKKEDSCKKTEKKADCSKKQASCTKS